MKFATYRAAATVLLILTVTFGAHAAPPAPPFEVAYRAWDVVTELARKNADANISGECGRTFRPFVTPVLRRQSKHDADVAATACLQAARAACVNSKLRTSAEIARKCEEFI